ncbi:MAG: DUF4080 domain-containing protein [Clostridia bacterium]|nr:DUF4080 domain-containing protein [Clostridia bacterium]
MSDNKRVLLAALNSQFIHSNTAVYYMHRMLSDAGILSEVKSFSINDDKHDILYEILKDEPDAVCFSCYIWNISIVYELCGDISKINAGIKLILGGPEVTYEPHDALEKSGADLIIRGEGENVVCEAVSDTIEGKFPECAGSFYKKDGEIVDNGIALTKDLSSIGSPFDDYMMVKEKDKLIYYEASRGCPFNCIYCLSSAMNGVRYFPLERVFKDLGLILRHNPRIIKFTDRSFNINEERTLRILSFIKQNGEGACFHLEIFPAGLTGPIILALTDMPPGLVQLEAGIQSVNPKTLKASGRVQEPKKALSNMGKLIKNGNIHIHLDLIAGLPHEDLNSFQKSFDDTISIGPHMLQIGFLKLLKGTMARNMSGYACESHPPYEVLSTPWMTFLELCEIKNISHCVDSFYNTGKFNKYLGYMQEKDGSPYEFYKKLSVYLQEKGIRLKGISRDKKYSALAGYSGNDDPAIEYLRFDFMSSYSSRSIPSFLGNTGFSKEKVFDFLRIAGNREKYFDAPAAPPKKLYKSCNMGMFDFGEGPVGFLFRYDMRNKVTGIFESVRI